METKHVVGGALGLVLAAAMTTPVATAQSAVQDAARNWAAVSECASVSSADRRHRCIDDVLRAAGVLDQAQITRSAREDFGREARGAAPQQQARAETPPTAAPVRARTSTS